MSTRTFTITIESATGGEFEAVDIKHAVEGVFPRAAKALEITDAHGVTKRYVQQKRNDYPGQDPILVEEKVIDPERVWMLSKDGSRLFADHRSGNGPRKYIRITAYEEVTD